MINRMTNTVDDVSSASVSYKALSQNIVSKYVKWSFGAGLIPAPLVDLVAVTAIQVKMISEIGEVYGKSFSEHGIRAMLASVLGGALPHTLKTQAKRSVFKLIPGLGTVVGLAVMPTLSAASTYAVGNIFIKHFESGGDFLSLNIDEAKEEAEALITKYRNKKATTADVAPAADAKVAKAG